MGGYTMTVPEWARQPHKWLHVIFFLICLFLYNRRDKEIRVILFLEAEGYSPDPEKVKGDL